VKNVVVVVALLLLMPTVVMAGGGRDLTETTAREWMSMSRSHRVVYVNGFLNGARTFLGAVKLDLSVTGESITCTEIEEQLFRRLLDEPELRSARISELMLNLISRSMILTDKDGNPIQSKGRYQ